jgi:DNA-binding beta-propeller fold protein YncE
VKTYMLAQGLSCAGLAVTPDGSSMFVSDMSTDTITAFDLPSGAVRATFGQSGGDDGQFSMPCGMCLCRTGQHLLVADCGNRRIQELSLAGQYMRSIGVGTLAGGVVAVTCNDAVVVASQHDCATNRIAVFSYASGDLLRAFGSKGSLAGQLSLNTGVCFAPNGSDILVADTGNHRVSVFSDQGDFMRYLSAPDVSLQNPTDLCVLDSDTEMVAVAATVNDHSDSERPSIHVLCSGDSEPDPSTGIRFGKEVEIPAAVAAVLGNLYVLDADKGCVLVYE